MEVVSINESGEPTTTLFCLISVGDHLELCIAYNNWHRVSFATQVTQVVSTHTEEYDIN